jgi:hypothetical protein
MLRLVTHPYKLGNETQVPLVVARSGTIQKLGLVVQSEKIQGIGVVA